MLLQIIDAGDVDQANWRLGDALPEFQTVPEGGEITIEVSVERPNSSNQQSATVELLQEIPDPTLPVISNGRLKTPAMRAVSRPDDVDLYQLPHGDSSIDCERSGCVARTILWSA